MASLRLLLPLSSSLLYYVVKIHHVHITVQCDALIKIIIYRVFLLHAVVRNVSLLLTTPAYQMPLVLTSAGTDGCILHVWLVFNQAC